MSFLVFGIVIAAAAAVRSTWSPCGLSMLSQITPVAEAGRGHDYARTAGWFILGAALGGVTLGGAIAAGAIGFAAIDMSGRTAIALLVGAAFVGAAIDARMFRFAPPFLRRQVNEEWLSEYRSWVYGGGFGWQIGVGVTTYVMTAAVPLMIVVGALSARPRVAVTIGIVFGTARGLAVLLAARLRTPTALYAFHRRFDAWSEPVRNAVIGVELAVAVAGAWIAAPIPIAAGATVAAVALVAYARTRDQHAASNSAAALV